MRLRLNNTKIHAYTRTFIYIFIFIFLHIRLHRIVAGISWILYTLHFFILRTIYIYIYIYIYTQGVTEGTDQTSGKCSLGQTIPI